MNHPYHNDQAHIAEEFNYIEEHTIQTARVAYFKINSYKLSLVHAAFCMTRDELSGIIKSTLLNYTAPSAILVSLGFFASEADN
jgi:hypothetical protein